MSGVGTAPSHNPFTRLRRYVRAWQERLPRRDTQWLTQRNVYILPTRAGLMLALTLLVLLIASINYQLNLGYLLTFLLAGSAVIGMHVAHGTLRGLGLQMLHPAPVFAGRSALLTVRLMNERASARHGIGLAVLPPVGDAAAREALPWVWTDVPAVGQTDVQVAFPAHQRGLVALPALTAETRFPLGTFRVWTVWRPSSTLWVFPRPEDRAPPLPPGEPRPGGLARQAQQATGEFEGVRAYRRGDPLKQVVWKKVAKAGELVSRDQENPQRQELWLDHARCGAPDHERRLSRLTAWVIEAERLGLDYGLRLPGRQIEPGQGDTHRRECLEALALA